MVKFNLDNISSKIMFKWGFNHPHVVTIKAYSW